MPSALGTLEQVIKEARRLLQDEVASAYRYPDTALVDALNTAMLEARRNRPDLFLRLRFELPYYDTGGATINMAAPITIDPMYRMSFVMFIVGLMELRDDENTQDARAGSLLQIWRSQLLSM